MVDLAKAFPVFFFFHAGVMGAAQDPKSGIRFRVREKAPRFCQALAVDDVGVVGCKRRLNQILLQIKLLIRLLSTCPGHLNTKALVRESDQSATDQHR